MLSYNFPETFIGIIAFIVASTAVLSGSSCCFEEKGICQAVEIYYDNIHCEDVKINRHFKVL